MNGNERSEVQLSLRLLNCNRGFLRSISLTLYLSLETAVNIKKKETPPGWNLPSLELTQQRFQLICKQSLRQFTLLHAESQNRN